MTDVKDVFVENAGRQYKVARLADFIKMRDFAVAQDSAWEKAFDDKKGMIVESRPEEVTPGEKPTGINIVRVNFCIPNLDPEQLYDSLHDPDFRKSWDTNMIEGKNLCQLDPRNDIGYYAAETPSRFVTRRDFCNQRSWMEFTNGDYLIMNHSEPHADCPEKKDFIRARSIRTGYYLQPWTDAEGKKGCRMIYVSHSDIKGSIPAFLMNMVMTKMAPKTMKKLDECARMYPDYVTKNYQPGFVGKWRTPKLDWDGSLGDGSEEAAASADSAAKTAATA